MPRFISAFLPAYSEVARSANTEGKAFINVLIDEHGHAVKAIIVLRQPADCTLFDSLALQAACKSRYAPGILNGRPVKVWCLISINFRLDN